MRLPFIYAYHELKKEEKQKFTFTSGAAFPATSGVTEPWRPSRRGDAHERFCTPVSLRFSFPSSVVSL